MPWQRCSFVTPLREISTFAAAHRRDERGNMNLRNRPSLVRSA
jgi:hypothetical protein